jgi:hypothetical protein
MTNRASMANANDSRAAQALRSTLRIEATHCHTL